MESSAAQTFLSDILHVVSQSLLAPDIILLLAFIGYALFSIGSILVELFTERRHFKVVMPQFLAALMEAKEEDIPQVIADSQLLNRQKEALTTVYEYRALPGESLVALVKRLVSEEETRYDRIVGRNNTASKVSPMLGLMGTLIPLGPGIQALGQADTAALSSSLLVAFDTTVAGLVTAAVCLVIGKIRSNWYEDYLTALDAAMATMLEKIQGEGGGKPAAQQAQQPQILPGQSLPPAQQTGSYSFLFDGAAKQAASSNTGATATTGSTQQQAASTAAAQQQASAAAAQQQAATAAAQQQASATAQQQAASAAQQRAAAVAQQQAAAGQQAATNAQAASTAQAATGTPSVESPLKTL